MGYGAPIYIDAHGSKYIVNLMKTKSELAAAEVAQATSLPRVSVMSGRS